MISDTPDLAAHPAILDSVDASTRRLLNAVAAMADADVPAPSLLPGWTRGHVLAHLSRNADGLVNLMLWARTGIETPQYASAALREADIEAGAPRPLTEQLIDLRAAADRWLALARSMPESGWRARVTSRTGREFPAELVPWLRLRETEIHHVDLNIGYRPSDWPASFVARMLTEVVDGLHAAIPHRPAGAKPMTSDPEHPAPPSFTVEATDTGYVATVGYEPTATVTGPEALLLAWLIGRHDGSALSGELPKLPSWL